MTSDSFWHVYIVQCSDGSLYTGIAKDLQQRIKNHNSDNGGAKYTRPRRPVFLVYHEKAPDRSAAAKREHEIKKMTAAAKRTLTNTPQKI
ncbi:MAG: GIY-YIG nuclease family protein [Desulfobulbaceae bacterium]|uniref:GIY-YIG nuclease family protein n=1 Tax=Candidatus Desulfobia pelagia TaxID=2841692 RepID=A0A8J6N9E5_9BACT|nr:GIY-YIG nuclease family protein [Candidatus Desulfobia pelagia]